MNKSVFLSFLSVFVFCSVESFALSTKAKQTVDKYLQAGKIHESVILLKNELKKNPEDINARLMLAQIVLTKDSSIAQRELERAKRLGALPKDWATLQAKVYLSQNEYERLIDELAPFYLNQVGLLSEWRLELALYTGDSYLALKHFKEAETAYRVGLASKALSTQAWLGIVQSQLLGNQIDEAEVSIKELEKKIALTLNDTLKSDLFVLYAELYYKKSNYIESQKHYEQALILNKLNVQALLGLSRLAAKNTNTKVLQTYVTRLNTVATLHPHTSFYNGLLLYHQKEFQKAAYYFENVEKYAVDLLPNRYFLSHCYYKMGRFEIAAKMIESYLSKNPDSLAAKTLQATVYLHLKMASQSIAVLEPLVKTHDSVLLLALLAQAHNEAGHFDKAIEYFERAAKKEPENPRIKLDLALSRIANNETYEAEVLLEELVLLDTSTINLDVLSVFTMIKNGHLDKAQVRVSKLIAKQPDNAFVLNLAGLSFVAKKTLDSAESYFRLAVEKSPQFIAARNNWSEVLIQLNRLDESRKVLKQTLKTNPSDLRALLLTAHLLELQKNEKAALKTYETARFRNPNDFEALAQLVDFHLRHHNNDLAMALARHSMQTFPKDPRPEILVSQLEFSQKHFTKALNRLNGLNKRYPNQQGILLGLAQTQIALKYDAQAQKTLSQLLLLNPQKSEALLLQAEIAYKRKDYVSLIALGTALKLIDPQWSAAYTILGDGSLGLGKKAESVSLHQKAYELLPNQKTALNYYQTLHANGIKQKASDFLIEFVDKNPDYLDARRALANDYLTHKKNQQAKEQYLRIFDKDKKDFVTLNNLAHLYLEENNAKVALQYAASAFQLQPDHPRVADTYAWALIQSKEIGKALTILNDALSMNPDVPELRYHRAVALSKLGQKRDAISDLEIASIHAKPYEDKDQAGILLKQFKMDS